MKSTTAKDLTEQQVQTLEDITGLSRNSDEFKARLNALIAKNRSTQPSSMNDRIFTADPEHPRTFLVDENSEEWKDFSGNVKNNSQLKGDQLGTLLTDLGRSAGEIYGSILQLTENHNTREDRHKLQADTLGLIVGLGVRKVFAQHKIHHSMSRESSGFAITEDLIKLIGIRHATKYLHAKNVPLKAS